MHQSDDNEMQQGAWNLALASFSLDGDAMYSKEVFINSLQKVGVRGDTIPRGTLIMKV